MNFWLFYSAFRFSIASAVIIFQLLQLADPTLNLGTFLQPLNLNKQTQNSHLLQLKDTCDASHNAFWFYFIRVATKNIRVFFNLCHKLQSSYICHCGQVFRKFSCRNMAAGCSLMVKVILLSCHRVSLRTPNLLQERVKKTFTLFW